MAQKGDQRGLMIDTAERAYSQKYLKMFRKFYPIIGMIGKSRSYDRFFINAKAILEFHTHEELNKIVCPTYIIGGDDDRTVGVNGSYEMKEKIERSKLHIYKGLGHAAFDEAKDFYSRVYGFLTK